MKAENNSTEPHGDISTSVSYIVILVNTLSCLMGIFGNTLIWFAVIKNLRLRTLANYFILSLALADMLVTCVTQPLFIASNVLLAQNKRNNTIHNAFCVFAFLSCMASILNLTGVSIDRLISLKYPLQKQTILPKKRGLTVIAMTWGLALVYTLISYFYQGTITWVIITLCYFTACYCTMVTTHSHMYTLSNQFVKRRKQHARRQSFQMVAYTREREAAKTVVAIIAVLTLTWLPYCCIIALSAIQGMYVTRSIRYPLLTIGFINSSINPVLYSWRNKEFRTTFWQLLRCQDPNTIRRESLSSLHVRRSRRTSRLSSGMLNDFNVGQAFDKKRNSETPCFVVNEQCTL